MRDFEYGPALLRVVPGDTVRWTNRDIVPHTVTATERGTATVDATADVAIYYCRYHPTMTATLEAEEPTGMQR